ncbi:substrate-binding domain-containing protein [Psychroflexus aestuariivivens]|uniref:substrate-binding domain-containing protein n=1 Tax=Psychroflexus aestuariivivens TaxID=1795040 RepID=UPI000FDB5218|nr:substrate-binding domain-containing protein [Psychroflexus aestuariivivens]
MTQIKIGGVPEHFNYPWHLCLEESAFSNANIELQWTDFHGGTGEMSQALKEGEIDLAIMLTEGSVKEIADGSPFKILQTYVQSPLMWGIHVDAKSKFEKLESLEGKTAAISRFGSGSHLMTYVNADQNNWETKELKFETTQNLYGAVEALSNGEADYFMWEHFTTKPLVDRGIFRWLGNQPTPWPCFVLVSTNHFIEANSERINKLLEIINRKTNEFKSIDGITQKIAEKYQLKYTDVSKWLSKTEWSQTQINEEDLMNAQDKLMELKLINKGLNYSDYIA